MAKTKYAIIGIMALTFGNFEAQNKKMERISLRCNECGFEGMNMCYKMLKIIAVGTMVTPIWACHLGAK